MSSCLSPESTNALFILACSNNRPFSLPFAFAALFSNA